jgi:peptidoglycan/xylan/chitin deacetylase (PgdA/CDA1 family)
MIIAWLVFAALFLVIAIPYVFIKHLGWGILRRGSSRELTIGLTFDDGPDPESTPRVLDILARHGVRATFFVVGEAARAHPDLVRRALREGHDVGSHGDRHRHALFHRPPLAGYFDTRNGIRALDRLTGKKTRFFRPPWGAYSWSVLFAIQRCRVEPVHWTVEAHDWHPRYAAPDVVRKVLAEAHAGGVIVMHDSGRGAPKTLAALDDVLQGLIARGLRPVPISQLTLRTGFPLPTREAHAAAEGSNS